MNRFDLVWLLPSLAALGSGLRSGIVRFDLMQDVAVVPNRGAGVLAVCHSVSVAAARRAGAHSAIADSVVVECAIEELLKVGQPPIKWHRGV